jgi:hypothetical protein
LAKKIFRHFQPQENILITKVISGAGNDPANIIAENVKTKREN